MSQLTRQDIAEVVEEVVDRKLDTRFDAFEAKMDKKLDKKLDEKLDSKLGAFIEHIDDKFNGLAEAIQVMNGTIQTLARSSELDEVKQDVKTIKVAVRATNQDLHRLEQRFGGLERRFNRWEQAVI
jgi:hypothetical protein